MSVESEPGSNIESVVDLRRYGTFSRLIGVTAMILRAVRRFKSLRKGEKVHHSDGFETQREYHEAELVWVKSAQQTISDLKTLTKQFNLFKDKEGVLRCEGRLSNAELPYSVKFPIFLPKDHLIASLIVKQAHERVLHNGVKETLAEMRSKYWIPSGRNLTRKLIHKCVICKKFEGLPFKTPQAPPLPECRLKEAPAFSYTGVDFAG